jgi:hypothetical protein
MMRNEYFENHPVYNRLPYFMVVGLIQLMIDEGLLSPEVSKGFYRDFISYRDKAKSMYAGLNDSQKLEYINFFRYKAYLNNESYL